MNDDDWEWVIPPEQGDTSAYKGADLSDGIGVGERVRELRERAGLSPQDVEDYSGIRKADLLAVEAGLLQLEDSMTASLCMVLGISAEELRPQ